MRLPTAWAGGTTKNQTACTARTKHDTRRKKNRAYSLTKAEQKEVVKEAIQEWLDLQFVKFGKYSMVGAVSMAFAMLLYLYPGCAWREGGFECRYLNLCWLSRLSGARGSLALRGRGRSETYPEARAINQDQHARHHVQREGRQAFFLLLHARGHCA